MKYFAKSLQEKKKLNSREVSKIIGARESYERGHHVLRFTMQRKLSANCGTRERK